MPETTRELALETEELGDSIRAGAQVRAMALNVADVTGKTLGGDQMQAGFAIEKLAQEAQTTAIGEMQNAIIAGYEQEMAGRSEISGGQIQFTLEESEKQDLFAWPIFGHTLTEISAHITRTLIFNMQSIVAQFQTGRITAETLPATVQKALDNFARQIGSNAVASHLAGAQVGRAMLGRLYGSVT